MDRGAWWATDHGVAKSQTRLSDCHFHFTFKRCAPLQTLLFRTDIQQSFSSINTKGSLSLVKMQILMRWVQMDLRGSTSSQLPGDASAPGPHLRQDR